MNQARRRPTRSISDLSRAVAADEIEVGRTSEEPGSVEFEQKHASRSKPAGNQNPMRMPVFSGYRCPDVGNGSGGPM